MEMKKLSGLGVGLLALSFVGCETTSNTNVNLKNVNNNTAVVVNSNTNIPATNVNANTTKNSNANVTRDEYDKKRADYEKDKGTSTIGQGANDSWLWFKTRTALLATNDLRESTVNVDVVNDVVTLKGTVENAAQKTKAESVAKGIEGVKTVKNELKVAPKDSVANQMVNGNVANTSNANKK